ncbi:FHA domain-containing protein [Saccharopolyspora sp. K220]|uniref:FHA domain-containing protein n=1 Tax=Saccharopolyspora soli TaxID=2926618 RepID=UPI001F580567|nr:FHA domain-containing protein [Saccharopolyspora soli]MCI2423438.1 FHA domain-containing protein [Saccharopolyspora soli]
MPDYPYEFRRQMVEQVRARRSPEEPTRKLEPSTQTIRNWVRQDEIDQGGRATPPVKAHLIIAERTGAGSQVPITTQVVTIGRHPGCGVVLSDVAVSRHHAALHCNDDTFTLVDVSSANGTHINDRTIRVADLNDGDQIRIGAVQLTFHTAGANDSSDEET